MSFLTDGNPCNPGLAAAAAIAYIARTADSEVEQACRMSWAHAARVHALTEPDPIERDGAGLCDPVEFCCPHGHLIEGTLELIPGCALITGIDPLTGDPEYEGETRMYWDDQITVRRQNKRVFVCEQGDEWTFDQLVRG